MGVTEGVFRDGPAASDASVMAFERNGDVLEGHASVCAGGVAKRISHEDRGSEDIGGGKDRRLTRGFCQLQSHYLFAHHFCRPARGNEKGVMEGQVKFTRLNFFVPVPQVRDFAELNARLRQQCVEDRERRLRGQAGPKAALLPGDQAAFLALPSTPFAACRQVSTTASSLSLVRFDTNDYSVPVRWAHHPIVVKGYWPEVVLFAQGQEVARHPRIWGEKSTSSRCIIWRVGARLGA
jgi:hypothetical protein